MIPNLYEDQEDENHEHWELNAHDEAPHDNGKEEQFIGNLLLEDEDDLTKPLKSLNSHAQNDVSFNALNLID